MMMILTAQPVRAQTVPSSLLYEGRILDATRSPVTSAVVMRFSLWKSADWSVSDTSGGAINVSSANYAGWYEYQTVTPSANGIFSIPLGNAVPLPVIDYSIHKFLQVEVKAVGEGDDAYVLLDPTGDAGADATDRKTIASVAYAKNAESVGNRTVGTGSGNILILGPDGKIDAARMGNGTDSQDFTINASAASGDASLIFGNELQDETIRFSETEQRFEFSDDVFVEGNLTASGALSTDAGITINADDADEDAILTFGNILAEQTLRFSAENQRFEFSTDVHVEGDLTVSGTINGVNISSVALSPLQASAAGGLTIDVAAGNYRLGNNVVEFAGASDYPVPPEAVSYVFFGSGGLTVRTMPFPTDESYIPVAVVTASIEEVTDVTDRRVAQSDTREQETKASITPEYDKATYQGDATDNIGMLSVSHDNISKRNYYLWTSEEATLQDYDILVRAMLPADFAGWKQGVAPVSIEYRSTSASAANSAVDIALFDTNGTPVSLQSPLTGLASTSWTTANALFAGSGTWTPGSEFLIKIHLSAKEDFQIHVGSIFLEYIRLGGG